MAEIIIENWARDSSSGRWRKLPGDGSLPTGTYGGVFIEQSGRRVGSVRGWPDWM